MKTYIYLDRSGRKTEIFHQNAKESWTHPYKRKRYCPVCKGAKR